jgi:hypothetical protein
VTEPPRGGVSSTRISLSDSQRSENTINTQSIQFHILSLSKSYYNLCSGFMYTKDCLKPKDASKDSSELPNVVSLIVRNIFLSSKRMPSISALSLRIPVRCPTLIGLDLPLATFVGIVEKQKKLLTSTQEITRAKLE